MLMRHEFQRIWRIMKPIVEDHPELFPKAEAAVAYLPSLLSTLQSRAFGSFRMTPIMDLFNHCPKTV